MTEAGLQYKIDESGASIGRRYARADELGIPFAVTFDFDTVGKGEKPALKDTVTLRERDSSGQVRVPLSEAAGILAKLAGASSLKFADLAAMYGDAAGAADADGVAGMMAYLRAHNITPKLNAAVNELAKAKPDDPMAALIELLQTMQKADAVADASDVRLQEAGTAMGAESEREPGAACDVSASPPEGAQAENAWTARAFASSLGVAGAVAEALLDGAAVPAGGEFEFMQSLAGRPDDIEAKLRKGRLVERVAKMLSKGAEEKLKTAEAKTGAELNDKFATDAFKGEMGFGGTAEYYRGARPTRT